MRRFSYSILLAALLTGSPAFAQSWQCRAPAQLSRPQLELPPKGEIRRTAVNGYVLALSWSREFCKSRGSQAKNKLQCNGRIGDFGFILHGLWPEARGPNYPQWCRSVGVLSRKVVARNICMTPDVQLMQREWAKHGSCMVRRPESYFKAARIMFGAIEFPDMDRLSRQGQRNDNLTAARLADAFELANEGLPANAIRVKTNRKGWLQEVRICLAKNFRPRRCPNHVGGVRPKTKIKIWRKAA